MKKLSLLVLAFFLALMVIWPTCPRSFAQEDITSLPTESKEEKPETWCPATRFVDNDKCMSCHVMSAGKFTIRQTRPDSHIVFPMNTKFIGYGTDEFAGLYTLEGEIGTSEYDFIYDAMEFFALYGVKDLIVEIHSYGGSLFAAWRLKGLIDEWVAKGGTVTTKVHGTAISAAALVFAMGQERIANPQAEIMFHELWTFKFLDITTPSDKEDEARVLRHLQDNITSWLATRMNMTKTELDDLMKKKEFWINGIEAHELGLATQLIGR